MPTYVRKKLGSIVSFYEIESAITISYNKDLLDYFYQH